MTEPVTTNKTLIIPNTGDLPGAWGTSALNPNFQLIDAMFGGLVVLSVGAATTIVMTGPPTSGVWNSVDPPGSNALIDVTGTQSGDTDLTFMLPGGYIVNNLTVPNNNYVVRLSPNGAGRHICVPQGTKTPVFYDGTDMLFVNGGIPGSALDLHGWTTVPIWITGCSTKPYLLKDGTSYSTALYPHLAFALAGAFGNSNPVGVSFNVPDEMARARIAIDKNSTGRLTSGVSGIDGATMGSAGGDQSQQAHSHANSLNDPGHQHSGGNSGGTPFTVQTAGVGPQLIVNGNTGTATTGMSITNAATGSGGSENVQPSIISFLPLVKT